MFFGYCGNGSKPDSIPAVLCGMVDVLSFPYPAVKAVGGNDIQPAALADFRGQAEIAPVFRYGKASVDGVFHQVPEQGGHVSFGGRQRLRQFDVPVHVYARRNGRFMIIAKQCVQCGIGTVVCGRVLCKTALKFCKVRPDAADVAFFREGGKQMYGMAEVVAQSGGLSHMFLQCPVLAGLHFKETGMFFQPGVFQYNGGTQVKKHINCCKDCKHTSFQQQKKEKHTSCMERSVGLGDSHYIEEQKDSGQQDGGVPYFRSVQTVNYLKKKPAGRPGESGCNQAGKAELEKSRFCGEVSYARRRVQESVKSTGELCRKGLDGTDAHIDSKALGQACRHSAAVWEKEQDEGRQEDNIYINPQQGA